MAKASINTGASGEGVHTRTTAGTEESQAVVLGIDGSDAVVPADSSSGLRVTQRPASTTTGQPTAAATPKVTGAAAANWVTAAVLDGMASCSFLMWGTHSSATVMFEVSFDGAVTWANLLVARGDTSTNPVVTTVNPGPATTAWFEGAIPAGATHIRIGPTTWVTPSGVLNLLVGQSPAPSEPAVALQATAGSNTDGLTNNVITAAAFPFGLVSATAWDRRRMAGGTLASGLQAGLKTIDAAALATGADLAAWTPTSGRKFRVMAGSLSVTTATSLLFRDSATQFLVTPVLAAGTPWDFDLDNGYLSQTANNVLNIRSKTGTPALSGYLIGVEE